MSTEDQKVESNNRGETLDITFKNCSHRDYIMMSYLDKKYPKNKRSPEEELAIATAYYQLCEDTESGIAHLSSIKLLCFRQHILEESQQKADEIIPQILSQLKNLNCNA